MEFVVLFPLETQCSEQSGPIVEASENELGARERRANRENVLPPTGHRLGPLAGWGRATRARVAGKVRRQRAQY